MIQVKNNTQLMEEEQAEHDANQAAMERQQRPIITSLAAYVRDAWQGAKEAKVAVEKRMIEALRQKNGEYSPEKLRSIQENGGSELYMMITDEKCAAAVAWLTDILFPADDRPWGTKPTPIPDLSPEQIAETHQRLAQEIEGELRQDLMMMIQSGEITDPQQAEQWLMQASQARAESLPNEMHQEMIAVAKQVRMDVEERLADIIEEGEWNRAVIEALDDVCTFPAGIIKGPVYRKKRKLKWIDQQQQMGQGQPQQMQGADTAGPPVEVVEETTIEFNRVSPFDVYPMPNARRPEDGIIERHSLTRGDLYALIGVDGYDDEAIQLVLSEYGRGGGGGSWLNIGQDLVRQQLENRPNEYRATEQRIDALQYWGFAQGLMLLQNGIDPERIEDPLAEYQVEVWLIDKYVIKCEINGDPLGRVPYHFAAFRKRNGSIWGAGIPEIMRDSQDACNASARNLVNNMGISSGPQVMYDVSQLPAGVDMSDMHPWKIWQVDGSKSVGSGGRAPISFFAPPNMAEALMKVYEFFSAEADTKTGVPKYSYGSGKGTGGALSTASGFSMMMNNTTRGIKNVIRNIDKGIIEPSIEMTHQWMLLYSGDPGYCTGDIKLIARGSNALIAKEQTAVRRNEFLQIALHPNVLEIIGQEGLAEIIREIVDGMDFISDDIVPSTEELSRRGQMQQVQAQQAQIEQQQAQGREVDGGGAVKGGADARLMERRNSGR